MNYKKCTLLACIMLLAACGPDDDKPADSNPSMLEPWQNDTLLPVKLTPGEASTRAADGLMNGNLPSGTDITVVIDGQEYTYQANDAQTEMTCITTPAPYYPINGQSISIKAYYPTIGSGGWYSSTNTWSWCVDKDQSTESGYKNSDRMYATVSSGYSGLDANGKVKPTSNAVPLTFNHLMAKVVLTITQPDDGTKIKEVALGSVKTGYNMDCVNNRAYNAFFWNTNPSGTITLYNNADGATGTVTCAGVFPPQTIGTDVNFISVTTTNNTIYYKLPQSVNFTSGQQYNYALSTYIEKEDVKVGNVICSDGTKCAYSQVGSRTPVAVILYVGKDTGSSTYKHGLALALSNVTGSWAKWRHDNSSYITQPVLMTSSSSIPVEDGASYRGDPYDSYNSTYATPSYPAFYYANKNNGTAAPPKTSGWFLPSAYQWNQVMNGIGTTDLERISNWKKILSDTKIGTIGNLYFWTCTEQTTSTSYSFYFNASDGTIKFVAESQTNINYVRAMLAF